jgi:nucleoside-diphosphate-sugar epimerase
MDTLVTGATGFAGRALVAALRAEGHAVRALVREGSSGAARKRLEGIGATLVTGDVRDQRSLERAARGCAVVFHGARVDDATQPRDVLEAVNLVGTENLLAACRAAGVRRLVYRSTADVTLGVVERSYVDEDFAQPIPFDDDAAVTRSLAEDLVIAASDERLETVTLRPGWLWGVDDTCLAPRVVRAARGELPWRWIDGGRSLCATTHVANLVGASLRAAVAPEAAAKVLYVTDDERVTVREFVTRLAAALGVSARWASLPYGLATALAWLGERRGERGRRAFVLAHGRSVHFNVQRARKTLDWAPAVDISTGLRAVQTWAARVGADAIARAAVAEEPPPEG